jgi:heat shock protein HslJ/LysM repeat protein
MVYCGDDSLSDDFLKYLSFAATYEVEGDSLRIDLKADGGSMTFARVEPMQIPTEGAPAGMEDLVGAWQWVRFSDPKSGESDIADPENYLLQLNKDGTVFVKADCNNAQGTFTATDGQIKIELGPTTLVYCGDDSRSTDFLKFLDAAATYELDGDNLRIDLMADGGSMTFVRTPAAQLPAAPPPVETLVDAQLVGAWEWITFQVPNKRPLQVKNPNRYSVIFNDDGTFSMKADCNKASGSYTAQNGTLNVTMGPSTRAQCSKRSLSNRFMSLFSQASVYRIEGEKLYLDLPLDAGTMILARPGTAAAVVQPQPTKQAPAKQGQKVRDSGPRPHARGKFNPPHYIVAPHDTLFSIAERFGVTVDELMKANNLPNNLIFGGMVLVIPNTTSTKPGHPPTASHYERVQFKGTASATLQSNITNGQPKGFILHGKKGQVLEINTVSPAENLRVVVLNNRGRPMRLKGENNKTENNLFVKLPRTGDYIIIVKPTTPPENRQLPFQITFVVQ